ncbi:MAG TPA: hypothetical protein VKE94_01510, partial [Gemmataceae bacterium]|nr:hypothetical protein [Gemmataceae bacterium]
MATATLPEHTIHVWYTLAPPELAGGQAARHLAILAEEEKARYRRFAQAKDRCQYLLGKVLTRTALSHYLALPPDAWIFKTNNYGKPILA